MNTPSPWVERFAAYVPPGRVLDVACGGGRHSRLFLALGHPVTAVDRDTAAVTAALDGPDLAADLEVWELDLEDGRPFPFPPRSFAGVVVTSYLWRPLLPGIVASVAPGGALIYETFAQGNERFGRPTNPDFLLAPGELLDVVRDELRVAYEDVIDDVHRPRGGELRSAAVQRIAAIRPQVRPAVRPAVRLSS